ncbi:DUF3122 domain-containing protein [Acaryochloris sp. CCMEE 5410]|uniref:DUF3122 domain-containing protein n=1 Tax=Acaryochloris sp. CCMEE 5410 TaxID=310037 RepID=UPI000248457C|nr:DUF3122 domain-containing protein [Acaryochloris sp. CCMEE 5410]KAI9133126.1 DUF3122 domain-containing protein [Acaryochloris sp. CCMEE 5410]
MMLRRLVILLLVLLSLTIYPLPVQAETHLYQEKPGQVTLRSQQSLQDQAKRSWQTILFKRYVDNQLEGIFLRLVGFPGQVEVAPEQPLQLSIADQFLWQSQPAMDGTTLMLPENVGQYNVQPLLENLESDTRLVLEIPLVSGLTANIVAPPAVIHEWREVTQFSPHS